MSTTEGRKLRVMVNMISQLSVVEINRSVIVVERSFYVDLKSKITRGLFANSRVDRQGYTQVGRQAGAHTGW